MKKRLKELLLTNHNNIAEAVIREALDHDDPKIFFEDLMQHGCVS